MPFKDIKKYNEMKNSQMFTYVTYQIMVLFHSIFICLINYKPVI